MQVLKKRKGKWIHIFLEGSQTSAFQCQWGRTKPHAHPATGIAVVSCCTYYSYSGWGWDHNESYQHMNRGRNCRGMFGRLLDMESDLQRGKGTRAFIICEFLTLGSRGSRLSEEWHNSNFLPVSPRRRNTCWIDAFWINFPGNWTRHNHFQRIR